MASSDASAPKRTVHFVHEWPSSRVIFGAGRVSDVGAEVARLGSRAMVINDPATYSAAQQIVGQMGSAVRARVTDVVQHVPVPAVTAAAAEAGRAEVDVIVCVGGGSAIGLAKGIARTAGLPIVAVPTTYAGSEMTSIWGLTEAGKKTTGRADRVRPRTVVYDPELTVGLPVGLSVTSGINAIAHCVEALYATGVSPLTVLAAAEGVRAMAAALPRLIVEPGDLDARASALRGAWLSGWSLEVSSTGLHHKLCHVLGGLLDLPHSPLHTVLLPYAVAHVAAAAPDAMRVLLRSLSATGEPDDAGGILWDRHASLDAPTSLAAIGMRESDLNRAVDACIAALADKPLAPREISGDELRRLVDMAWRGDRPSRV
jgi:maleylacetate reductase